MPPPLPLDRTHLRPGLRVAVAVSGGADSVALLRALLQAAPEIGLVLSVAHLHHGIRGAEADADAAFVRDLAAQFGLPFREHRADTPARAHSQRETLEEAARNLRYHWFRELLAGGALDAIATAHTLDDQAETVLHKLLRGAWTEGLGGIHPVLRPVFPAEPGLILRPFLATRRAEIEAWLRALGQPWREDATNADTAFTRNRIRHELLPQLATYNPQIRAQLANLAQIARDEEAHWQAELSRLLPALLLPGRAVRGGGRAVPTHPGEASLGIELDRLRALSPALRRRVLRASARELGIHLEFEPTLRLLAMLEPASPRRETLTADLRAERTARELRLIRDPAPKRAPAPLPPLTLAIPGQLHAEPYSLILQATLRAEATAPVPVPVPVPSATLRPPRPGDRIRLRHTSGPKPLKEVWSRLQLDPALRASWPLLEWQGQIVWMKDVPLELPPNLPFTLTATPLDS